MGRSAGRAARMDEAAGISKFEFELWVELSIIAYTAIHHPANRSKPKR